MRPERGIEATRRCENYAVCKREFVGDADFRGSKSKGAVKINDLPLPDDRGGLQSVTFPAPKAADKVKGSAAIVIADGLATAARTRGAVMASRIRGHAL